MFYDFDSFHDEEELIKKLTEGKSHSLVKDARAFQGVKELFGSVPSSAEAASSGLGNVSFWEALKNKFTGNIDYQRNLALQQQAQVYNAEQASIQRAENRYLSNTAYQRQVADLKDAGYNPAMAVGAGGAYTPSAAAASSPAAHYSDNTRGFEMIVNGLIAGLSLGIKATQAASQVALNSSNQLLNGSKGDFFAARQALDVLRGFTEDKKEKYFDAAAHERWARARSYR